MHRAFAFYFLGTSEKCIFASLWHTLHVWNDSVIQNQQCDIEKEYTKIGTTCIIKYALLRLAGIFCTMGLDNCSSGLLFKMNPNDCLYWLLDNVAMVRVGINPHMKQKSVRIHSELIIVLNSLRVNCLLVSILVSVFIDVYILIFLKITTATFTLILIQNHSRTYYGRRNNWVAFVMRPSHESTFYLQDGNLFMTIVILRPIRAAPLPVVISHASTIQKVRFSSELNFLFLMFILSPTFCITYMTIQCFIWGSLCISISSQEKGSIDSTSFGEFR